MKSLPLLLTASLVANAALVTLTLRRASEVGGDLGAPSPKIQYASPAGVTASPSPQTADSGDSSVRAGTAQPSADAPPPDTWRRLHSANLATFVANLRASGLPDRQIRLLVNAEINDRFSEREEAARPARPARNFWEQNNTYYNDPTTLDQRLAQLDIRREKDALRRELLGDQPAVANDGNPIPSEKRDLVRQLNEDYNTMIGQIQRDSRGITLASDDEQLRYLRAERDAELKTLLTPEELREYEIRSSTTANNLRSELSAFDASEQEFRAVFTLRKQFDDQFANQPADPGPEYWKQRNEAQKQVDAQIAQHLGAERYRDYLRSKDHEYRNLATLTERVGLPQSTATQVYDLRYSVPASALQVVRSPDLTPEAKEEGLKTIAQKTREQLTAQLGAEAAEAYLKRHGEWIKSLERGQVIEFRPDGSRTSYRIEK